MKRIVWLASYPKSGNTWFRAFLANLQQNGDRPVDINELNTGGIASARPPLDGLLGYESSDLLHSEVDALRSEMYLRQANGEGSTLFIKVHDAYTYLNDGSALFPPAATRGALYIIRNPLDVCVSYAHHAGKSEFDKIIAAMADPRRALSGRVDRYQDQLRQVMLSWSGHVLSWINAPGQTVHMIRYEDMKQKPLETFSAAARFAGLPHEQERVSKALKFSSFDELKRQEQERGFRERLHVDREFFRKGCIGSWREVLTQKQVHRIIADHADVMRRFGYLSPDGDILH